MPLSAEFDGQRVISLLMSDDEWAQARTVTKADEQRLLIGYSRLPGFPRVAGSGLRHFAHRPGYKPDYEWQETIEHLTLKAELVRLIAAAGWEVDTEVPNGPDRAWIADVLATGQGRRIAFEVQWSYQSAEKYLYRQQRYAQDGVECVWVVRREPDTGDLDEPAQATFAAIPIFPLVDSDLFSKAIETHVLATTPTLVNLETSRNGINLGAQPYDLGTMVHAVLDEQILAQAYINLDVYETPCEHCRRGILMWDLDSPLAGNRARPEETPVINQYVTATRTNLQINAPLATIAFHRSGTLPDGYKSFICPHCHTAQGAYTEHDSKITAFEHARAVTVHIPATPAAAPFINHWDLPVHHEVVYRQP